jgi:uncharacterized lipoprotein YajG
VAICLKSVLVLSFLLLAACTEQPVTKKPTQPAATVATKPAGSPSNVHLSENEGHSNSVDGAYYVQNRIFSSGGAVSGAMMGS